MGSCCDTLNNILIYILIFHIVSSDDTIETETLLIKQINQDGFGDLNNQYAFSMESFKGNLYVGTLNAINPWPIGMIKFFFAKPFNTNGTQIWKGELENSDWKWTRVITNGNGNIYNYGVRKFKVIGDYLYGVTANHITGFEVWRTFDGINWEIVSSHGFNDTENTSGRGLIGYNSYIYVGGENRKTGGKIWRRSVTETGKFTPNSNWEELIIPNVTRTTYWFSDFIQYKSWLYMGTLNPYGLEIWRTDSNIFENVFAFENDKLFHSDMGAMKLYVYKNILYFGTINLIHGASLYASNSINGTALEFEPIFINGNGNSHNKYVWYMKEFNNRLYVGTFSTSGVFSLFSSENPLSNLWTDETLTAFGMYGQYGIRSMVVFNDRLMIGTATPGDDMGCKIFECIPKQNYNNDSICVNNEYYDPNQFNIYDQNTIDMTPADLGSKNRHIDFFSTTYGNIKKFNIYGFKPKPKHKTYALYIHLTGTTNNFWDETAMEYTKYMSWSSKNEIQFVSVSIEYDVYTYPLGCSEWLPHSFGYKARLLWDINNKNSAISILCNKFDFINCNKGIVISGFSQGAQLALQSAKYGISEGITALYLMSVGDLLFSHESLIKPFLYYPCLSFNALNINKNKIRSIVHENDEIFGIDKEGVRRQQISITNQFQCDHDHDINDNQTYSHDCIGNDNGSGFYILSKNELDGSHCYMFDDQFPFCIGSNVFNQIYYNTNKRWGFKSNMNWLINMVKVRNNNNEPNIISFNQQSNEPKYPLLKQIVSGIVSFIVGDNNKYKKGKDNNSLCSESVNSFTDVQVVTTVFSLIIIIMILLFCILCHCINDLNCRSKNYISNYDKVNAFEDI